MKPLLPVIKSSLNKAFDIRQGEFQRVLLLQLNIFLVIFTLLILKPVVNAQFLTVIGVEQLPFVFVLVALSAIAMSSLYARALDRVSMQRITVTTLTVSIVTLLGIALLLHFGIAEKLVLYVFYVGVAFFGVLTTSQFWILANLAFDAREAKRLFGFIGAGPIAGGVAGGYATSVAANYLESPALLCIAALLLAGCIPLTNTIWKKHIKPLNTIQRNKRMKGFGDHPLRMIAGSRHLTYLALLVGLGVVVSKLVDFQFSSVAIKSIQDPDELTAFFGFWFSTFNVVSLLIQLFLTRRIVGTFGVGSSLFALPGGVLMGSLLLLFTPVLWAGIFTKLWEVSVKQSVNKAATELLALPIPAGIKSQTKSFIDVVVDMAATGIGGLLLIVLVNGLNLSVQAVSLLTIVVIFALIFVSLRVRREYFRSFKAKLTQADIQATRELPDFSNKSVLNGLRRALETGTEKQILYVLQKVQDVPDKRLYDDVARYLSHPSTAVRSQALHCIYFLDMTVDGQILERLLHDPDLTVRTRSFAQLFRQTRVERLQMIHRYLQDEDPMVSGAALVGIAAEARNNPEMKRLLKMEDRLREKLEYAQLAESPDEQRLYRIMVLRAAGQANLPAFYPLIDQSLDANESQIIHEAISAAGATSNLAFIVRLAPFLVANSTRKLAQDALLNMGVGITQDLLALGKQDSTDGEIARMLPSVLERIDDQRAVNALMAFLDTADVSLRLEALRSLNTMKRQFPHLKVSKVDVVAHIIEETSLYKNTLGVLYVQHQLLPKHENVAVHEARANLIERLERRMDSTLERIFRLLGLRYPPEDVISAYQGIRSVNPHVRMNSVEFLDNLLEPNLKRTLLPIAESAVLEGVSNETIQALKVTVPDERKCLSLLLEGRDPRLKISVFELIQAMGDKQNADLVRPFLNSFNERVKNRAAKVLASLGE